MRLVGVGTARISISELVTGRGVRVLVFEGGSGQHATTLYPTDWYELTDNSLLALRDIAIARMQSLSHALL